LNQLRWSGVAYAMFHKRSERRAMNVPELASRLNQARITLSPAAYLALGDLVAVVAAAGALAFGVLLVFVLPVPHVAVLVVTLVVLPWIAFVATELSFLLRPTLRAKARARSVETNLPYAASFVASFAASGATPKNIFHALAREEMYGEISEEARWIYRDVSFFGMDIVNALSQAAQRSPSRTFAEFLHGTAYTISTGGDLKSYFMSKASQLAEDARRNQRKFSETLALLSETYVTVAVAGPLFLIVVLSVMTLASRRSGDTLWYMNLVAFAILPMLHLGFALVLKNTKPEA
jgi:flagellar protein FlaJ